MPFGLGVIDMSTYSSFEHHRYAQTDGYNMIAGFCEIASKKKPLGDWLWIDICCIGVSLPELFGGS
jgi:hypothetical protein